jgi:hypothetical protein
MARARPDGACAAGTTGGAVAPGHDASRSRALGARAGRMCYRNHRRFELICIKPATGEGADILRTQKTRSGKLP